MFACLSLSRIKRLLSSLVVMSLLIFLSACGGGSGGGSSLSSSRATADGVFLDSAVEGIFYVSGSVSGYTDATGAFSYEIGNSVSFYIGDVELGSALGESVITPIELVPGATDTSTPRVVNILRFLQTLDDDDDVSNGIQITQAIRDIAVNLTINFDLSVVDFENNGAIQVAIGELTAVRNSGARVLVSSVDAIAHFQQTLDELEGQVNTGELGGLTITGADTGVVGNTFTPDSATNVFHEISGSVSWNQTNVAPITASTLAIGVINPDNVVSLAFAFVAGPGDSYAYSLACPSVPSECGKVSLDRNNRTLTIDNALFSVADIGPDNNATSTLRFNGTLDW